MPMPASLETDTCCCCLDGRYGYWCLACICPPIVYTTILQTMQRLKIPSTLCNDGGGGAQPPAATSAARRRGIGGGAARNPHLWQPCGRSSRQETHVRGGGWPLWWQGPLAVRGNENWSVFLSTRKVRRPSPRTG